MPQISVIVPVYKVEKYLSACVESILAQTFRDFELILVDDGSPDTCGAMCDAYAQKDTRVRVIHQENQGLSGARNSAMDIAEGDYITFVDSDDMVTEDFLESLHLTVKEESASVAVCQMYGFEDGRDITEYLEKKDWEGQSVVLDNREACVELYNGSSIVPINACAKLFRRELIGERRFPVGRVHEDQAFTPYVCYAANKVVSLPQKKYCYRTRPESITREKFSLRRYDDLWAIDNCIAFFESEQESRIVAAAKEKRKRLICIYSIYAKRDGVEVPKNYQVSAVRALSYLRRHVSDERFNYYLGQVNKKLAYSHEYWIKIKKILKISS